MNRRDGRLLLGGGLAVLALTAGSTAALAAAGVGPGRSPASAMPTAGATCAAPVLAGAVVDVTVTDMGGRMRGAAPSGGPMMGGPLMGGPDWGMARVTASPSAVPAGTVSLRVTNTGRMTHEIVVLPLADGQRVGQRKVGGDGRVDESASVGEASRTCDAGAGSGIRGGGSGWVTVTLPRGRYELVCNLPGHYAAGMHAELDVA